jgi:hypothetical protein
MTWLRTLDDASAPCDINWWLRTAVRPQQRAHDGSLPNFERREWAELYLSLIRASERFAGLSNWDAAASTGNLRSLLIAQLGSLPDHPVWDVAALVRDTLATLTLTPDEARSLAQDWPRLPTDQMRLLRNHKNVLAPLELVIDQAPAGPDTETARVWLRLRRDLP